MVVIGFLLAISISAAITSIIIVITGSTGLLSENLVTGAIIGPAGVVPYALVTLAISLIATVFLITILRKPNTRFREY